MCCCSVKVLSGLCCQLALLRAQTELDLAERKVAAAESELAVREADLAGMKSKLDEAVAFKTALKEDADGTRMTMTKANQLITGLGGEREKWEKDVAKKQEQVEQLPHPAYTALMYTLH